MICLPDRDIQWNLCVYSRKFFFTNRFWSVVHQHHTISFWVCNFCHFIENTAYIGRRTQRKLAFQEPYRFIYFLLKPNAKLTIKIHLDSKRKTIHYKLCKRYFSVSMINFRELNYFTFVVSCLLNTLTDKNAIDEALSKCWHLNDNR